MPDYCISGIGKDVFIIETQEELPDRELVVAWNDRLPLSRASLEFLSYFQNDAI